MKVALFNTYKVVVPADEMLIEALMRYKIDFDFFIVSKSYRDSQNIKDYYLKIEPPKFFFKRKSLTQLFYLIRVFPKIIFSKYDHFVFFTQPPFLFLVGSFILRWRKKEYSIYSMDVYPDLLFHYNKKIPFKKIISEACNQAYKKSKNIVVLGQCMKDLFLRKGINNNNISVIPNTSYVNDFKLDEFYGILSLYPILKNKFIILYSGNMGIPHIFSTILEVAQKLNDYCPNILFVFVGKGRRKNEIQKHTFQDNLLLMENLDDVLFKEINQIADCHFISLRSEFTGVSVPSKFYSSLASGKPVIFEGDFSAEISRQIKEHRIGETIKPFHTARLLDVIKYYNENPAVVLEQGKRSLSIFNKFYTRKKLKSKYEEFVSKL